MNIKNLFGYTRWIYEVCQHPDHRALKARNDSRLAALKATNSLTENERTRARTDWPSSSVSAAFTEYARNQSEWTRRITYGLVNSGGRSD